MYRPDFIVRSIDGKLVAVAEVKSGQNFSSSEVSELHNHILDSFRQFDVNHVLVVTQDSGFIWDERNHPDRMNSIRCQFPMATVIQTYLVGTIPGERLRGTELEFLVFQWLIDLAINARTFSEEVQRPLAESGFLSAIRDGKVVWGDAR
jgi:hypothetical protein